MLENNVRLRVSSPWLRLLLPEFGLGKCVNRVETKRVELTPGEQIRILIIYLLQDKILFNNIKMRIIYMGDGLWSYGRIFLSFLLNGFITDHIMYIFFFFFLFFIKSRVLKTTVL